MKEDTTRRRRCPKCEQPIEKNQGCSHMQCISCKTHICWKCMATFGSAQTTYDHIHGCRAPVPDTAHGGFNL